LTLVDPGSASSWRLPIIRASTLLAITEEKGWHSPRQIRMLMNNTLGDVSIAQSIAGLRPGDYAEISYVAGGRMMTQRLAMLGIRPGVTICLLHGPGRRGAVLRVGGSRVALGRGVIEFIMVKPQMRTQLREAAQ
jgi:ferrous iron transport protein A